MPTCTPCDGEPSWTPDSPLDSKFTASPQIEEGRYTKPDGPSTPHPQALSSFGPFSLVGESYQQSGLGQSPASPGLGFPSHKMRGWVAITKFPSS